MAWVSEVIGNKSDIMGGMQVHAKELNFRE